MAAVVMVLGGRAGGALGILPYYASAVPHAKETVGGSLHDAQGLRQGQTLHFYLPTPVVPADSNHWQALVHPAWSPPGQILDLRFKSPHLRLW